MIMHVKITVDTNIAKHALIMMSGSPTDAEKITQMTDDEIITELLSHFKGYGIREESWV
jgi:hypothetical protein